MRRGAHGLWAAALVGGLLHGLPQGAATACTIDNVASLLADGVPAMRTTSTPRAADSHDAALWAPFTLAQAVAVGVPVHLSEAAADLARTLPPRVRAAPYRWTFGDRSVSVGHSVVHRYARPGAYRLTVWGYDTVTGQWFAFDAALVRVVPAGQLLRANLEYEALRAVLALSGLTWPVDAVLVVGVLALLARRMHGGTGLAPTSLSPVDRPRRIARRSAHR